MNTSGCLFGVPDALPLLPKEDEVLAFGHSVPLLHFDSCSSGATKIFFVRRLGIAVASDRELANCMLSYLM